jgi:hypothetical protein
VRPRVKRAVWLALVALSLPAHADIYRWGTGEVIPGTEGITPGPGVQLQNHELGFATLHDLGP